MPPAMDEPDWPILVFLRRLRASGVRVGPGEQDMVLFTLSRERRWTRDRLRSVLDTLLVRSPADRQLFTVAFERSFPPGSETIDPFGSSTDRPSPTVTVPVRETVAGLVAESVALAARDPIAVSGSDPAVTPWSLIGRIWSELLSDGLGWVVMGLTFCGFTVAVSVLVYGQSSIAVLGGGTGAGPLATGEGSPIPLAAWGLALLAAAGLLGPILFAVRWATRRTPVIRVAPPAPPVAPDDVAFRVGLVGGPPPARVHPDRLRSIADLIGYRASGENARDLDPARSIDAVIRNGGMPVVCHPVERVLPAVWILVDACSPGRHWNTTPYEMASSLASRGVDLELREFPGTLRASVTAGAGAARSALGRELADLPETTGYSLLMIVSDGARWRDADTALLEPLLAHGPIFWFDDRDRELWDSRLDGLRRANIPIYEATDAGIEEALRADFAPGRGIGTRAATAGAALARRRGHDLHAECRAILGAAIGWARHCALLEPISVALAERLRERFHPALP